MCKSLLLHSTLKSIHNFLSSIIPPCSPPLSPFLITSVHVRIHVHLYGRRSPRSYGKKLFRHSWHRSLFPQVGFVKSHSVIRILCERTCEIMIAIHIDGKTKGINDLRKKKRGEKVATCYRTRFPFDSH